MTEPTMKVALPVPVFGYPGQTVNLVDLLQQA